ncbi:MAG: hypothetical protein F6K22_05385 [Okeania sp. SIO2F4]|uniref:Stf0 family sulfotransferase n=1 Tax=Okeania sp. SIO2F4 TaxID=2607790 RepID=UPI0014299B1D|nr:Stf0 family sulfotransferase [Okeania sp. SIO2F4]NES02318.1 hypothetical protein [Okeania sp. SIO2F4]
MAIDKSYIICSIGRSGSSLLASVLRNLGYCGNPREYFHPNKVTNLMENNDSSALRNYIEEILKKGLTNNGIFGVKMHWEHMRDFLRFTRKNLGYENKTDLEIINDFFPNTHFIYIRRENILKQAISTEIAQQTQIWHQEISQNQKKQLKKPNFNPLAIYRIQEGIKRHEGAWQRFFRQNDLDVYEVIYENFCQSIETTTIDIIKFMKIEPLPEPNQIQVSLQKQSSNLNERWEKYYNLFPKILLKNYSQLRSQLKQYLNR